MQRLTSIHPKLPEDREQVPRILVRAVGGLMLLSLVLTTFAVLSDRPLEALPLDGPIAEQRIIRIYARQDGSARVLDQNGGVVADLRPDEGGFISGVSRALTRVRGTHGVAADEPVRLIRYQDGRLALRDDLTGWRAELIGFGADNTAAFARLLD
ncbi:MAG: photosynthetic complex assembly protein PuhC [Pseudomonadota bacterium]